MHLPLSITIVSPFFTAAEHHNSNRSGCQGLTKCVGLQHVFAVTQPVDDAVGGHLYYSKNFGKEGSWEDATSRLEGRPRKHP
jgi:hypothetical protein